MITIEHDKKKYKIPNEITEFTIIQYQKVMEIEKGLKKYERFKEILFQISNIPNTVIDKMQGTQISHIINGILVMLNQSNYLLQKVIKIDGELYHFEDKIDDIVFEQFIDLVEFTDDEEQTITNLHLIAALLYRKVIGYKKEKFSFKKMIKFKKRKLLYIMEDYNSDVIIERSKIFQEKMSMDVVYGMIFFFMHLKLEFLKLSVDYLEQEKKEKEMTKTKKN